MPIQPGLVPGPVPQLMQRNPVVVFGCRKLLSLRQMDGIIRWTVICLGLVAMYDIRAGISQNGLRSFFRIPLQLFFLGKRREAVNLLRIESVAQTAQRPLQLYGFGDFLTVFVFFLFFF